MQTLTLNTGAKMPTIGLGTWKSPIDQVEKSVEYALAEASYNHIDCASIYRNEKGVGNAFKKVFRSGKRKRSEVFITSKLWNTEHKGSRVGKACEETLSDLKLDYLDLYLMHWGLAIPSNTSDQANQYGRFTEQLDKNGFLITEKVSVRETWEAMEELVSLGLVKAIGVANFTAPMLIDLLAYSKIKPAMLQVELHPYLQQQRLLDFCKHNDITVTAYSPLGSPGNYKSKGKPVLIEDIVIRKIAKDHKKSVAQVLIRWAVQRGTVVIPKSVTPDRIMENIDVFNFELSSNEMQQISGLNKNVRYVDSCEWWKIPYFD